MIRYDQLAPEMLTLPGGEKHIKHSYPFGFDAQKSHYAFCSFSGGDDLVELSIWADAVHRDGGFVHVGMPYLPGARQDRRQTGEAFSAQVYADLINGLRASKVTCLDPHSLVMPALVYNLEVIDVTPLIRFAVERIEASPGERPFTGVIIPDAGAGKRAIAVADALKVPYYQALKHRDSATGKLSRFTCEPIPKEGRYLVVDDICDGGGTFVGLARAIGLPREQMALWVTHGIFSGDNGLLDASYDLIMTTNSHVFKSRPQSLRVIRDLYEIMKGNE